jgi:predicted Zn-dependent peptidase
MSRVRSTIANGICGAAAAFALIAPAAGQSAHIVEKITLGNGARAVLRHEPQGRTLAIGVFIGAGVAEDGNQPGIGALTSRALFGSNLNQSREEVLHTIYSVGGDLQVEWTPDYTHFATTTRPERMEDALYMMCQAIKGAQFDAESVEAARADLLADLAGRSGDSYRAAYAALRQRAYRESPYREAFGGSEASIKRITSSQVRQFHRRFYVPSNIVFSIVGNVKGERVRRALENYLGDVPQSASATNAPRDPEILSESGVISRFQPTNTATIVIGFNGPGMRHPDYPAFALLATILGGGKSSRLWRAIRDSAGVGYMVRAHASELAQEGQLILHLEYAPARPAADGSTLSPKRAGEMMLEVVDSLTRNPPTEKELDRAKTFMLGSHALAHQRARDRAFHLGWYEIIGLGHEYDSELPAKTAAVTLEQVHNAARKYLERSVMVTLLPSK